MDFELSDDEQLLMEALEQLTRRHGEPPRQHTGAWYYGDAMEAALIEKGFLGIGREADYGRLQAALVVEHVARQPAVVEIGASALVLPQLLDEELPRPLALIDARDGRLDRPVRFLSHARSALVDLGDDVAVLSLKDGDVEAIDSFLAFPFGRLRRAGLDGARRLGGEQVPQLRQWWRVASALELAGAMLAALERTVAYVKERRAFGQEIGSFQAVQHRLAYCAQMAHATRWLALRAADSGEPADAWMALGYAQDVAETVYYDVHQFTGAIGLTFEYPLHYWTLRIKVLQAELGGAMAQLDGAAQRFWTGR